MGYCFALHTCGTTPLIEGSWLKLEYAIWRNQELARFFKNPTEKVDKQGVHPIILLKPNKKMEKDSLLLSSDSNNNF